MKNMLLSKIKKTAILILSLCVLLTCFAGCSLFSEYYDKETGDPVASVARISLLKKTSVKSITSTTKNVFYLLNNAQLLASGSNENGMLGQGNNTPYDYVVKVKLPERIKLVAASENMGVAVSDSNSVYVWGDLSWWGIRINYKEITEDDPELIYKKFSFNETITAVSVSENHIAVMAKDGSVYTLGFNFGQLGYDFDGECYGDFISTFRKIETGIRAIAIETNPTTTYILSNSGEIYGCSMNKNHELGYISKLSAINKIDSNTTFRQITTAGNNLIALSNDKKLYVCGANTHGVLGLNSTLEYASALVSTAFEGYEITNVYGNDTLNTLYITTADNLVFACGQNTNNVLYTLDTSEDVRYPSKLKIGTALRFFGTGSTLFYTDANSNLYTYGNNKYSQMPDIASDGTDKFVSPQRIYANVK